MRPELPPAAGAECTQALKRKMARTNQSPPVSTRPRAAQSRKGGKGRGGTAGTELGSRDRERGKGKVREGVTGRKGKERTVTALNRGLGKRKSGGGSRGRKCINKTSQTGVQ